MLTCQQASQLLSEQMDGELPLRQRMGLRLHLMVCEGCHNLEKQFSLLRSFSRTYRGKVQSTQEGEE
jgi:predicted anti-sigma-YlaC factor YlaD